MITVTLCFGTFLVLTLVESITGCFFPLITETVVSTYDFCESFWGQQNYCALIIKGAGEIVTEIMDVIKTM